MIKQRKLMMKRQNRPDLWSLGFVCSLLASLLELFISDKATCLNKTQFALAANPWSQDNDHEWSNLV